MTAISLRPAASAASRAAIAAVFTILTACDAQWGGGRIALENPAPVTVDEEGEAEEPLTPLPDGPLLYIVRSGGGGRASVTPIARITEGTLDSLSSAAPPDESYRARFDSTFLARGTELALLSGGRRIGSLILEDLDVPDADCPSVATAQALLPPGSLAPGIALAVPLDLAPPELGRAAAGDAGTRMATYGPVLAEQLLRAANVARPFLAQRVALEAVQSGDSLPALAATYLINDSLAPGPPRGDATSLFYLARDAGGRGYVPVWREIRNYSSGDDKEAFAYLDWIELDGARIDLMQMFDGAHGRLVANRAPPGWRAASSDEARDFVWREAGDCAAIDRVGTAGL